MPKPRVTSPSKKVKKNDEIRPDHYVYIEKGHTKNLENYNSAKITVGLTVRVNPTKEELADIKKTVRIVDSILDEEMENQIKEFE